MAFDTARHQVVLFGGVKAAGLNDTGAWNGEVWTQLEDIGPSARSNHAHFSAHAGVVLRQLEQALDHRLQHTVPMLVCRLILRPLARE